MRGWCTWLVLVLGAGVPAGMPEAHLSPEAPQIHAPAAPSAPSAPSSPEPAPSLHASFLVEIVDARVLFAPAAAAVSVLIARAGVGPGETHARLIERPPIASLLSS